MAFYLHKMNAEKEKKQMQNIHFGLNAIHYELFEKTLTRSLYGWG